MFLPPRHVFLDDAGSTTEEAILMIVLATFAIGLFVVVKSDPVRQALAELVHRALNLGS